MCRVPENSTQTKTFLTRPEPKNKLETALQLANTTQLKPQKKIAEPEPYPTFAYLTHH